MTIYMYMYSGGQIIRIMLKVCLKGGLEGARVTGLEGGLEGD